MIVHAKPPDWLIRGLLCPAPAHILNQPDDHENYSDYQCDVDSTTQRKRGDKSQQPQYQENDANNQYIAILVSFTAFELLFPHLGNHTTNRNSFSR